MFVKSGSKYVKPRLKWSAAWLYTIVEYISSAEMLRFVIIIIIIKRKLKAQINRKTPQMHCDGAATENCS